MSGIVVPLHCKQKQRDMEKFATDYNSTTYKFSLNKKYKTLKVYQYLEFSGRYVRHLIARNLTKEDIRDFENMTSNDLLYWMKHDFQSTFSIWR